MVIGRRKKSALELTFSVVEFGEGVLTNIPVSEEHAELTSAKMGPDIFGVDYQYVSEEQKQSVSLELGWEENGNCSRGQQVCGGKESRLTPGGGLES